MRRGRNIFQTKAVQSVIENNRSGCVFESCKWYFQGLIYFTGLSITKPNGIICEYEPTPSGAIIFRSTSALDKNEFFNSFQDFRKHINLHF